MSKALERALLCFGGNKSEFARELGVGPMVVAHWFSRGVPADRIVDIERVTKGEVKRQDLRPDLFVEIDYGDGLPCVSENPSFSNVSSDA